MDKVRRGVCVLELSERIGIGVASSSDVRDLAGVGGIMATVQRIVPNCAKVKGQVLAAVLQVLLVTAVARASRSLLM